MPILPTVIVRMHPVRIPKKNPFLHAIETLKRIARQFSRIGPISMKRNNLYMLMSRLAYLIAILVV